MTFSPSSGLTIAQALSAAQAQGLERLDAQLLLLHALGRATHDRAWLLAHDSDALDELVESGFQTLCRRRLAGEPCAYLTGHKEFFGLTLAVDARVLVPRPDTETLVEWGLACLSQRSGATVLDLGTGSGAIALAIKAKRPDAVVSAVDASADALGVAQANAERLALPVEFVLGSWFGPVRGAFELVVSNPPYVAADDPHLAALGHEPLRALSSGTDGLDDIRQIVQQAPAHLRAGGWLLLEHGYDQAVPVRALLERAGFARVQSRTDLGGIERCSGGQWPTLG
jgi:release factor glutamine methyltransferase